MRVDLRSTNQNFEISRIAAMKQTFVFNGHEWVAESCVNEEDTKSFIRVKPATKRRVSRQEYHDARAAYFESMKGILT